MNVAIITDQHMGARNDSIQCLDYYQNFYENVFFPTLEREGIDTVLILGDTFDRRKYINFNTLYRSKQFFFEPLRKYKVIMIAGNHDTYYRNTNLVNSPELVLREYDNITLISSPTTIDLDGHKICMLPWICQDNYDDSFEEISKTEAAVCMGHLEISGFKMYRSSIAHEGMSHKSFEKFDMVFSGHFHHKSDNGHIYYLGNPHELTWQDYGDPRGFHLFNLESRHLTFVKNPYTLFERFEYSDDIIDPTTIDVSSARDKYVKVVVVNKSNFYEFDRFIERIKAESPIDVKIVENFSEFNEGIVDDTISLEDTETVLMNYIDSLTIDIDKDPLKLFLKGLYTEALNVDAV